MSVHTPGPWSAKNDGREPIAPGVVILDDDNACGDPECCGPPTYWISIKREDANLIAAAPDMLAALQAYVAMDVYNKGPDWYEAMRAAIAKATGAHP